MKYLKLAFLLVCMIQTTGVINAISEQEDEIAQAMYPSLYQSSPITAIEKAINQTRIIAKEQNITFQEASDQLEQKYMVPHRPTPPVKPIPKSKKQNDVTVLNFNAIMKKYNLKKHSINFSGPAIAENLNFSLFIPSQAVYYISTVKQPGVTYLYPELQQKLQKKFYLIVQAFENGNPITNPTGKFKNTYLYLSFYDKNGLFIDTLVITNVESIGSGNWEIQQKNNGFSFSYPLCLEINWK